jgi:hypothetical protein
MKFRLGIIGYSSTFPLTACSCRFKRRKRSVSAILAMAMNKSMKLQENVATTWAIVAKAAHAWE